MAWGFGMKPALEAAGPEVVAELAPVEADARRAQAPELVEAGPGK